MEIGGQLARYHYAEPGLIDITGNRAGVVGLFTFVNPVPRLFTRIDVRESYGSLRYEGSGTQTGIPDWITEARIVSGKDFLPGESISLSPYLGLGYRFLYNDLRGYSSTGNVGYRRYSNYSYAPIGLTSRISIGEQWVLAPTGRSGHGCIIGTSGTRTSMQPRSDWSRRTGRGKPASR